MEYLTCCGRGIQSPDEIIIDGNVSEIMPNPAVFSSIPAQGLINALSEIIRDIAEIWYQDSEVIEVFIFYICLLLCSSLIFRSFIVSL